jgi:release factor glutamine methyltransferase
VAPAGGVLPAPPLLTQAAGLLRGAGLADPRREALRIWRDLTRPPAAEFLAAVARRAGGEPLAYVTGRAGFRHLTLRADRRALIPRPETEQLVELALSLGRLERIADVGTGSGCIALSLAVEGGCREVIALDRSAEALTLAAENREQIGARAVRLVRGDLTSPLTAASLDLLVSNPPYLTDAEWETLDRSVAEWEPRDALAAGPDGLRETRALLTDGVRVVRPGGWIVLELDSRRARAVATTASALGWQNTRVINDLFGRERFLLARRSEP